MAHRKHPLIRSPLLPLIEGFMYTTNRRAKMDTVPISYGSSPHRFQTILIIVTLLFNFYIGAYSFL